MYIVVIGVVNCCHGNDRGTVVADHTCNMGDSNNGYKFLFAASLHNYDNLYYHSKYVFDNETEIQLKIRILFTWKRFHHVLLLATGVTQQIRQAGLIRPETQPVSKLCVVFGNKIWIRDTMKPMKPNSEEDWLNSRRTLVNANIRQFVGSIHNIRFHNNSEK